MDNLTDSALRAVSQIPTETASGHGRQGAAWRPGSGGQSWSRSCWASC